MTSRAVTGLGGGSSAVWPLEARVGAVAATVLLGRFLAGGALATLVGSAPAMDLPGEVGGAIVSGLALAWIAGRLTGSPSVRFAATTLIAFASVAAVMLEGSAFAPELSPLSQLAVGLPLQLAVCLAVAAVAIAGAPSGRPAAASARRSGRRLVPGLLAASGVYVAAYLVTGAINYLLVTGPYYESHAGGLTTPEPGVVLAVAAAEGATLALATLPVARLLPGSTRSRALACGLVLWLLGGLAPLLQAATLPDVLRVASAVEILFQKVPLGIAVVWFGARSNRSGVGQ